MFEIILIGAVLYYVKDWTRGKVMHHPERQTVDAVDRKLQWAIVVAVVWYGVHVIGIGCQYLQLAQEIRAMVKGNSPP